MAIFIKPVFTDKKVVSASFDSQLKISLGKKSLQIQAKSSDFILNPAYLISIKFDVKVQVSPQEDFVTVRQESTFF